MNALEYFKKIEKGEWVPRAGSLVNYHLRIGGPITTYNHKVVSVFAAASGNMVCFISDIRAHMSIEHVSKSKGD